MNPISDTNLTYDSHVRNVLVSKSESGAVLFDGQAVALDPFEAGTLVAEEAPNSTDFNPTIRVIAIGADGTERKIIFKAKKAFFWFKSVDGVTSRISTKTNRADMVQEVLATLNECFAPTTGATEIGPSDLTGETVCFSLDATSTSVVMDTGHSYGVNTLKAVAEGGTITIKSVLGDRVLHTGLEVGHASKPDCSAIPGGLNDVVNYLNELFTVGPFESVVISDPFSTMVADVAGTPAGYTLEGSQAADPAGTDIFVNQSSGNYAGLKSTATIDQAGEYFTFDIRNLGQIGFGLVHTDASYAAGKYRGNATYADPAQFAVGNSAHFGFQFSHWFHPTPKGSWTNYGADTSYSMRPGWSNWDQKQDWIDGNPVKIRVGLDHNGYISIESLQDDSTWVVHARSTYVAPEGVEYHLGIKTANSTPRVYSAPMVHLLEPAAPVMQFRYIESPDGNFEFPLFATEEEANYYDSENGGSGTSHTHTYTDDPTGTTWYMPDTNSTMTGSNPPTYDLSLGQASTYTEITSLTNADLVPPAFSYSDISIQQGDAINIQVQPADVGYVSTVSGLPAGAIFTGGYLIQGTITAAPGVYTVVVTRTNTYGSSTGDYDIEVTAGVPATTNDTPWTKALDFDGSSERAQQVTSDSNRIPMKMGALSTAVAAPSTPGYTSEYSNSRPWATAIVFKVDTYNSNQHIWNVGEGAGDTDDNIYLRRDTNRNLWFGWGRPGKVNECFVGYVGDAINSWHAVYVAHNGTRYALDSQATADNLAAAFDIRYTRSGNSWAVGTNQSTNANWTAGSTGARMNYNVVGDMTIGGRGSNRSFRGKVASYVSTTLRSGVAMPTDAEIGEMIIDPKGWLTGYKVGNAYRLPWQTSDAGFNWNLNDGSSAYSTQVWLMGDGTNDSYSNMIRNEVLPSDQNYTKLNLISMVSNDIQNITIPGLS